MDLCLFAKHQSCTVMFRCNTCILVDVTVCILASYWAKKIKKILLSNTSVKTIFMLFKCNLSCCSLRNKRSYDTMQTTRAPDKVRIFISIMPISTPNQMFDNLLESSRWDDSNKWSNIGFVEEITEGSVIWNSFYAPYLEPWTTLNGNHRFLVDQNTHQH